MGIRNIIKFGDEMLRLKSREVTVFDKRLHTLLDDMKETMNTANGVGLAAPQIGILRRVVIIDTPENDELDESDCPDEEKSNLTELINPIITVMKGTQRELEGCLSSPGKWGYVVRPYYVKVSAKNRFGEDIEVEGEGLRAVAFCHEIDHLNGVLFIDIAEEILDKLPDEKKKSSRRAKRAFRKNK